MDESIAHLGLRGTVKSKAYKATRLGRRKKIEAKINRAKATARKTADVLSYDMHTAMRHGETKIGSPSQKIQMGQWRDRMNRIRELDNRRKRIA